MESIVKKVYVLDGGSLEVEASGLVSGKNFGQRVDVPVQMFLVDTTEGYILVDSGNDPDVIDDAEGTWGKELVAAVTPRMSRENHPYRQLELLGLTPGDIRMVIYTHLHHDHSGGARFFPEAMHVAQKAEYRWAFHPDRYSERIYLKSDFDHARLKWRLADGDWCIFPGVHLLSTPGHTPGHQSVVLWGVPDCGTVIIAGDAVYCRANIEEDTPSGVNTDVSAALLSMHRLTALAQATDATLLVSHETAFFELLPKAPAALGRLDAGVKHYYEHGVKRIYGESQVSLAR